ncbi:MAG: hypothetical protein ACK412_07895, partial [Chloroherpetonaceae bacterium]
PPVLPIRPPPRSTRRPTLFPYPTLVRSGFYEGRFRDKQLLVMQTEYRRPIAWRFGIAVFLGLGSVSGSFDEIALKRLKTAYGIGVRFAITPEERVFARIDFGKAAGIGTYGFYVQVNEAF